MSNLKYGPKIVPLGDDETINSIERWRQSVLYLLRLNEEFRPYLKEGCVFGKKSKSHPCRNFTDSFKVVKNEKDEVVKEADGSDKVVVSDSKEDKCYIVDLLLDQIANFCDTVPPI